jgi:hypothetical protein
MGISARLKRIRPGYRTASVLAGTAVFAGAAFFVTTGANADTQPVPKTFSEFKKAAGTAAATRAAVTNAEKRHKLPNARPATKTDFKLGKTGPAFQLQPRIIRGNEANPAQHPSVIGILTLFWEYNPNTGRFEGWESTCTGTVLSSTRVLTAGHCSFDSPLGRTLVIAGRSDLHNEGAGFATTVRTTFTHQGYVEVNGAPNNDVAVLTLTNPLPPEYTPVTLDAQGAPADADGTSAQIVGYGVTSLSLDDQNILREGTTKVRADATCSSEFGSSFSGATMLCGGTPNTSESDVCAGDSGGPLFVTKNGVKTEIGITSWGAGDECGTFHSVYAQVSAFRNVIDTEKGRSPANNLDWTGDGHSDLIGRDGAGNLLLYSGSGLVNTPTRPAFGPDAAWIGEGWSGFRKLFRVYNWNNDNKPSVFGVDGGGNLLQYKGDGEGGFVGGALPIGNGWAGFNDIMVTNNWTGNGRPNLLGRTPNGDLYLYTSNGAGGWENNGVGIKIGNGWGAFNTIITPGDWLGDGRQALIGRTPSGDLRLYQSNGQGGWVNGSGVQIGNGWSAFSIFMSPGDFNGDNLVDMIGVTPGGSMRLYKTDGRGNWLGGGTGQEIGSGWNGFNAIF